MGDLISGKTARKAGIRHENETRILDAACAVFAESGLAGATVGEIATRAEVPKANVLYYFGTKEKLYARVLEQVNAAWLEACEAFLAADDPKSAIGAFLDRADTSLAARPCVARLWVSAILDSAGGGEKGAASQMLMEPGPAFAARLESWQRAGIIRQVSPVYVLHALLMATALGRCARADCVPDDGREPAPRPADILLTGLLP